eukprot:4721745-Prymnesium_polylepis.2
MMQTGVRRCEFGVPTVAVCWAAPLLTVVDGEMCIQPPKKVCVDQSVGTGGCRFRLRFFNTILYTAVLWSMPRAQLVD